MNSLDHPLTIMTIGTFDQFHEGHKQLLDWISGFRYIGGETSKIVVGVNKDEFVEAYKGRRPVESFIRRRDRVHFHGGPKIVESNPQEKSGDSIRPLIEKHSPDFLVVGDDWMGPHYLDQIGMTMDELWDLQVMLAFKPRGPEPVHSSHLRGIS